MSKVVLLYCRSSALCCFKHPTVRTVQLHEASDPKVSALSHKELRYCCLMKNFSIMEGGWHASMGNLCISHVILKRRDENIKKIKKYINKQLLNILELHPAWEFTLKKVI